MAEARAAAEAAKFRLEAAKLQMEIEQLRGSKADASGDKASAVAVPVLGATEAVPAPVATEAGASAVVLAGPDARAFVGSPVLRRASEALLCLKRKEGGEAALEALVLRACDVLETGVGDVDGVVGGAAMWEGTGFDPKGVRDSFLEAAELLTPKGSPSKEVKAGGSGDRMAALKMIAFDQLPDLYRTYGELLELSDKEAQSKFDDGPTDVTFMDPSISADLGEDEKAAARFMRRVDLIASDTERVRARMQRLCDMPLVKEVMSLVTDDADIEELTRALEPLTIRIYNATRTAQLRALPAEEIRSKEVKVLELEFNIFQAIGALVVVIALAFFAAQAVKESLKPPDSATPFYSLSSNTGQRPSG